MPDLPKAKYIVWVRGYGFAESSKAEAKRGRQANLKAVPAANGVAAASPTIEVTRQLGVR